MICNIWIIAESRSFGYQMTLVCVYTEIQMPLINNHRIGLELPYSTFNFGTFCIHIAQCIMGYYVNYTNRAPIEFSSTNLKLNCKVWQLWFRRRNNLYFVAYEPTTLFTNLIRYCIIYAKVCIISNISLIASVNWFILDRLLSKIMESI